MLTHKKPEHKINKVQSSPVLPRRQTKSNGSKTKLAIAEGEEDEHEGEEQALWAVGEVSDVEGEGEDEDVDHHQNPVHHQGELQQQARAVKRQERMMSIGERSNGEEEGLMQSGRHSIDPLQDGQMQMEHLR